MSFLEAGGLTTIARLRDSSAAHSNQVDRGALISPIAVVDVVKAASVALVEDGRATKSERVVRAKREAGGIDGSSLGRVVKLPSMGSQSAIGLV